MHKITVYQIQSTAYQISLKVYNIVKNYCFYKAPLKHDIY